MKIAYFSAALLASSLATAATPIDGLYGSIFGGYSYIPNNISKQYYNPYYNPYFDKVSNKNGFNAGARFGFQGHPMRYEGEFTYIHANSNTFKPKRFFIYPLFPHRTISSQTSAALGMANIYYDFPMLVPCISPFLGVGIGFGWVESSFKNDELFYHYHFKASDTTFAYQGTAGLTFNFSENYSLNLAYRYVGTSRVKKLGNNFQANLASIGVVYRFNEYNYK